MNFQTECHAQRGLSEDTVLINITQEWLKSYPG